MAGPTILVKVLGDLSNLSKSFKDAESKAAGSAKGIHAGFSTALAGLNATGVLGGFGDALDGVDQAIGRVIEHGKKIGPAMAGAGTALLGVGAGLQAIGSKDKAAQQQLQQAIEATGKNYEDYAGNIEQAIKHQEKFGHTANETEDALRTLTQATGDPAKALQYLGTASDLAAAKHESLNTAAGQLGKTYNGAGKMLKEFGVVAAPKAAAATKALETATRQVDVAAAASQKAHQKLADLMLLYRGKTHLTVAEQLRLRDAQNNVRTADDKLRDAHNKMTAAQKNAEAAARGQSDTMTALSNKLKGQASAAADTFMGKLSGVKAKLEDSAAAFGQKYGPAIMALGAAFTALGSIWEITSAIMAAAEGVALGPILLIVAAVAGLVAVGWLLYKNWDKVWGFIKRIVKDVWGWIKDNWPLLLGVLTGPFGIAAALIYKYWDQVSGFFKRFWADIKQWADDAWQGIVGVWQSISRWLSGIPGAVTKVFTGAAKWLAQAGKDIFTGLWNGIVAAWRTVWGWITKVPGWIVGLFDKAIGWLYQAGVNILLGLYNGLVAIWRNVWAWISKIPGWILGNFVGGLTLLYSSGASIIQGLWNGITAVWTGVWKWFTSVPGAIIHTFDGALTWLAAAGGHIIEGLFAGIRYVFGDIASWVKRNIVDPLVGAVKHFFGIASPSTVMADIGKNLLAGLFQGLSSGNWLDVAKTIFGGLPEALGHLAAKGLVGLGNLPKKALDALGNVADKIPGLKNVAGFAENVFSKLFGGGGGGGNVGSWIAAAMKMTGVPAAWAGPLGTIIKFESGGNPKAINLTDINAIMGHPSQGLMQTIPSTFAAYALPGFNKDITDPVSNIIAGIRYIQARYGDIFHVPGIMAMMQGRPYIGYDAGGILPPGLTMAVNNTGRNEYVSTTPPGRNAPAIHIENAHFASELDIDSFLRQAAWLIRTQAV